MASLPNSKTVTYEEWLRLPQVDDATEEVVNGEIRITPPAKWKHQRIIELLSNALRSQLEMQKYSVACGSFGLIIQTNPLTSRVPDLAVFDLTTIDERDGYMHSAPQLLVEVLSPANTRRERTEKLADYATLGVPEVWVVSPEARTVEILYLDNGLLRTSQILANGVLTPRLFPHVQIDIATIWPD
ncbi:MAG TPA: Uma2 family endonuclease [Bryobacteraceae bacterium]|jgi:Uma2 family endonuclease|nr:Uma2 family endonuclease [Bryobacteraceae bacterium]